MQEYMARRAEWAEVRRVALERAKAAPDERSRKAELAKLAEDEKPSRGRMDEAARAYQAILKRERDAASPVARD